MPSAAQLARLSAEVLGARAGRAPRLRLGAHELTRHAGVLYAFRPLPPAPAAAPLPAPGAVLDMGVLGALHVRATVGRGLALGRGPFRMGPRAGGERLARVPGGPRRPLKDWLREAGLPPWARARALLVAGDALAAVVLPHATWVAAEARALGAEPGVEIEWRDAPAVLLPVPCTAARVEPEAPFR
jgi:tRNA(Ile)-lysidine synthetase-like protein